MKSLERKGSHALVALFTCPHFTIPTALVIVSFTILFECIFGSSRLSIIDAIIAALVHRPASLVLILLSVTLFTAWKTIQSITVCLQSRYEHKQNLRRSPPTPLAEQAARQYRVKLSQIEGTGAGGQVTRDDVLNYVSRQIFPKGA
jgi:hypothetical protein